MYYQDQVQDDEDDLYKEDAEDSDGSEVNSELEFHLYSQLHYSNPGDEEVEVGEDERQAGPQQKVTGKAPVDDGGQRITGDSQPLSPEIRQPLLSLATTREKSKDEKKRTIRPGGRKPSSFMEEVIVIDSGPDIISISDSDTSADDVGVCASKGQRALRPQTSTPAPQVCIWFNSILIV